MDVYYFDNIDYDEIGISKTSHKRACSIRLVIIEVPNMYGRDIWLG